MESQTDHVLELHFRGGVYDSKTLDEPALVEIVKIIHAVTETARSLWRRRNPSRQRLPNGFDESVQLGLRDIGEGSAVPALVRTAPQEQLHLFEDDVTEAVTFVHRAFEASQNGLAFPEELDDQLCDIYGDLGTKLPLGCTLEFVPTGKTGASINAAARQQFLDRVPDMTTDIVDISGRVLAADVHRRTFQLWLDSAMRVDAKFSEEQERRITEALHEHDSLRVRLRGSGQFRRNGEIVRVDRVDRVDELGDSNRVFDSSASTISEMVAVAFSGVPDDVWASLPTDLAERHDEYLSGRAGSAP